MAKNKKRFDDEDVDSIIEQRMLPYAVDSLVINTYTVPIDEDFVEPSYYRGVCKMLYDATEHDIVKFQINSFGGRFDGLVALLQAIESTNAITVAEIIGECHSSASLLALSCDEVAVGTNANMLCHYARWGFGGKGGDVVKHSLHQKKIADALIERVYADFLTKEEIELIKDGHEHWLTSEEIQERLEVRKKLREEE